MPHPGHVFSAPAPCYSATLTTRPKVSPMPKNLLARATSPYLQQHADNPVNWHEWDGEALTLAREQGKPILLSISQNSGGLGDAVVIYSPDRHLSQDSIINR